MDSGYRELAADERANLLALLDLLPPDSDPEILLRAEGLREMGCFEEAAQVLDHEFSDGFISRAEQIMQATERQDSQPFFFQTPEGFGLT